MKEDTSKLILEIAGLDLDEKKKILLIDSVIGKSISNSKPIEMAYKIGKNYLIRGVTMIYTGKIIDIIGNHIILSNACWIADTKRWTDCLKLCETNPNEAFNECEPYIHDVIVHEQTIIDSTEVSMLPSKQI